jgi:2'-5' RNA ligase
LTATGLVANFWPTLDVARDRFVLACGLIVRERVSINKVVDDLSPIEKHHLFTVLEEKLDYLANLEESIRKKAVKAATTEIGTLQQQFKAHLRKKYLSEEETPFVKHAFLQQQDWDMFVQETNSSLFQQLS